MVLTAQEEAAVVEALEHIAEVEVEAEKLASNGKTPKAKKSPTIVQLAREDDPHMPEGVIDLRGLAPEVPDEGIATYLVEVDKIDRRPISDPLEAEFIDSIAVHGVKVPVLLRYADGRYHVVEGDRRVQAAVYLGLSRIPARIEENATSNDLVTGLLLNLQRSENFLGQAEMVGALMKQKYTEPQIAAITGVKVEVIRELRDIYRLPKAFKTAAAKGQMGKWVAKQLIRPGNVAKHDQFLAILKDKKKLTSDDFLAVRDAGKGKSVADETAEFVLSGQYNGEAQQDAAYEDDGEIESEVDPAGLPSATKAERKSQTSVEADAKRAAVVDLLNEAVKGMLGIKARTDDEDDALGLIREAINFLTVPASQR